MQKGIAVTDLTVTYRNGHTALRDASFSVPGGSIAALVGVNGSGKSTLFKAVMGFVRAASGSITIEGLPPHRAAASPGAAPEPGRLRPAVGRG